jgi:hypothetical protein
MQRILDRRIGSLAPYGSDIKVAAHCSLTGYRQSDLMGLSGIECAAGLKKQKIDLEHYESE